MEQTGTSGTTHKPKVEPKWNKLEQVEPHTNQKWNNSGSTWNKWFSTHIQSGTKWNKLEQVELHTNHKWNKSGSNWNKWFSTYTISGTIVGQTGTSGSQHISKVQQSGTKWNKVRQNGSQHLLFCLCFKTILVLPMSQQGSWVDLSALNRGPG